MSEVYNSLEGTGVGQHPRVFKHCWCSSRVLPRTDRRAHGWSPLWMFSLHHISPDEIIAERTTSGRNPHARDAGALAESDSSCDGVLGTGNCPCGRRTENRQDFATEWSRSIVRATRDQWR